MDRYGRSSRNAGVPGRGLPGWREPASSTSPPSGTPEDALMDRLIRIEEGYTLAESLICSDLGDIADGASLVTEFAEQSSRPPR